MHLPCPATPDSPGLTGEAPSPASVASWPGNHHAHCTSSSQHPLPAAPHPDCRFLGCNKAGPWVPWAMAGGRGWGVGWCLYTPPCAVPGRACKAGLGFHGICRDTTFLGLPQALRLSVSRPRVHHAQRQGRLPGSPWAKRPPAGYTATGVQGQLWGAPAWRHQGMSAGVAEVSGVWGSL